MSRGPFVSGMDHAYYYQGKLEAYRRALSAVYSNTVSGKVEASVLIKELRALLVEACDNKALEEEEGEE